MLLKAMMRINKGKMTRVNTMTMAMWMQRRILP
jgi:hypothetical protein